jgi:tRNA A37 N6-isopentenylltransferase MiaA
VTLDVPEDELDRRIAKRAAEMAAGGAVEEAREAWAQPLSDTARKVMGLEAFATLPLDEALEEVVRTNRRLARYQRKWLRRLPGAVRLAADRPTAEIADEILTLGRTGERLPRR